MASHTAAPGSGGNSGPCPGSGYTCDGCIDGWFCPPSQTPALPAPCGTGWPCYHCSGGWFCIPSPTPQPTTVTTCPTPPIRDVITEEPETVKTQITVTATTVVVARSVATAAEIFHPAVADWSYGGCYKDDIARSLKDSSITGPLSGGMTTDICITFCRSQGFALAGTKNSFQCFCGSVLFDSVLVEDTDCSEACSGDASQLCGGIESLSIWSADGKVTKNISPDRQFVMPVPTPGQSEMLVNTGGLRQMVIKVTTPVEVWPPPAATQSPAGSENAAQAKTYLANGNAGSDPADVDRIDVSGIASTVHAIVSAAIKEAHAIAASEVAKVNSMIAGARAIVG
ncbi:WSC domain-containing protein, partial [Immersiella caudata]